MSIEILDCLKRKRDICIQNIVPSQNTVFMWIPALKEKKTEVKTDHLRMPGGVVVFIAQQIQIKTFY